jgi:succinoglycan biosynthesis protein ExoM
LLAKALASIMAQRCPQDLDVGVLVVDNSDEGTARNVVEQSPPQSPFDMRWVEAHPANIAVARNVGVQLARTEYIAFLDDDNELKPGWLEAVALAISTHPHDVFFGALDAEFEKPERATRATQQLFSRRLDAPMGSDLFAFGPQQTREIALGTGNSVIRRAALPQDAPPFDVSFGHGGGEDYDLFCRMQRNGSRFGWLPGARAQEYVPASRCHPSYLRRRFFVGGQTFAAGVARASARPWARRWWLRLKAVVQALAMAAAFPLTVLRGGEAVLDYSYRFAGILGKMSFGGIYPIYRRAAGASK